MLHIYQASTVSTYALVM